MEKEFIMGMTITEKILADHCGMETVKPGQIIEVKVDLALANDITAPIAIRVFKGMGVDDVFDRARIALVQDHFVPSKDIPSAEQSKLIRDFAGEYGIELYFEVGESGVEHILLPEKGLIQPGTLVIGADSHTCTYGALGAFSTGVGSTDLGVIMGTGRIWLRVPGSIKININGSMPEWVGGKDIVLYLLGILGEDGANYRALEFSGTTIESLSMADRFTISNMAVECGAKNGIFPPDSITYMYLQEIIPSFSMEDSDELKSDDDAEYEREIDINAQELTPQVAFPHSPSNVRSIAEVGHIPIDQVFIGSCTNGRLEDLRIAGSILKGRKVSKGLRLIILPGTPRIYKMALKEGLLDIFIEAGAVIGPPSCGPCLGGHLGILAKGERAVSTGNRNFIGRMGHPESEVYLSGPAIASASAVLGRIASPEEL